MSLYSKTGERLYLTANEREAFLRASRTQNREVRTFCTVLHDTGCRLSEALALTPQSFDFENQCIIFETLKKRHRGSNPIKVPNVAHEIHYGINPSS